MTTVTSVDNSKFWTNLLRKGLILYVILACFLMFRIDIDYSVPPQSIRNSLHRHHAPRNIFLIVT